MPSSTITAPTTTEPVAEASVESTTTAAPETTSPPEATPPEPTTTVAPETTQAPTTTTAATGDPTTVSTEYFLGGEPTAWLYLGRWTGNAWETDRGDDQTLREPAATDGDDVVVHELDVDPTPGSLDGTDEACPADGRVGPVISPAVAAPDEPGAGFRAIAFPADWPTRPRPVALVDASVDSYVAAGAAAFDDLGIETSSGAIEQLVVADLDGDGDSEALVAFDGDAFSALLLIDTDTAASITIARSVATTVTPTTVSEDDPPGETTTTPNDTFRTLDVVDLNGDGRYEIVTHSFGGGDADVTVNTYDGSEVDPVLATGC